METGRDKQMGTPNNSYAREARRNLREGIEARREADERDRQEAIAQRGTMQDAARKRMQRRADMFDALEVGDSLAAFGPHGSTVVKKNRKSVVDSQGIKWTRYELTGHR